MKDSGKKKAEHSCRMKFKFVVLFYIHAYSHTCIYRHTHTPSTCEYYCPIPYLSWPTQCWPGWPLHGRACPPSLKKLWITTYFLMTDRTWPVSLFAPTPGSLWALTAGYILTTGSSLLTSITGHGQGQQFPTFIHFHRWESNLRPYTCLEWDLAQSCGSSPNFCF